MGIDRKSRKLKGKKRQTGRKIRRGTGRNRLRRVSRMKGGMQPSQRVTNTTNTFQSECENIKNRLETLRVTVRNTLQEGVAEKEEQIRILTEQVRVSTVSNEQLIEERNVANAARDAAIQALIERDREDAERAAEELVAAQNRAGEMETELVSLRQELERAHTRGESVGRLESELNTIMSELQGAREQESRAQATLREEQGHLQEARAQARQLQQEQEQQLQEAREAHAAALREAQEQASRTHTAELQELREAQEQEHAAALREARAREQALQELRAEQAGREAALQEAAQARAAQTQAQEAAQRKQAEFDNMIDQIIISVNALNQACVIDINAELDVLEQKLIEKGCLEQVDTRST